MNRREFLKALAALPIVDLLTKFAPGKVRPHLDKSKIFCQADIDYAREKLLAYNYISADAEWRWDTFNSGIESVEVESRESPELSGRVVGEIIDLEFKAYPNRTVHIDSLAIESVEREISGRIGETIQFTEHIWLVPVRHDAMICPTWALSTVPGPTGWSVTINQSMPQMWTTPRYGYPRALDDCTGEIENV